MKSKLSNKIKNYLTNTKKILVLYGRVNKGNFLMLLLGTIITALIPLANAYIFKLITDEVIKLIKTNSFNLEPFTPLLIAYILLNLIKLLSWQLIIYYDKLCYLNFGKYLDITLAKKFSHLGFEHFAYPKTNDLLNRVKETYSWRPINFASRQVWTIQTIIEILANTTAIIIFSPWIFLAILISAIPEFFIQMKYGKNLWNIHVTEGAVRRNYWNTNYYLHTESYIEEIRVSHSEGYLIQKLKNLYKSFLDLQKQNEKKKLILSIISSLVSLAVFTTSEILIVLSTISQKITIGSLGFLIGRIYKLNESFLAFFKSLGRNYEDLLFVDDLFTVLELKNRVKNHAKAIAIKTIPHKIEFKNVWFKYPHSKEYVLKNFNLTIDPKEKIAIIGENGGGKTTIVKLLCRFFDVNKGQILIDGIDIKKIELNSWHQCIGVLFQRFNTYAYSVKDNIRISDIDKKYEKQLIETAAEKAQAHSFIKDYKSGYKTILSKKFKDGTEPSIGQWQKISLARTFFRNAPILILDEPTSAIDAKAEIEIFEQLEKFENDKTVITISHRFSTVKKADKIYIIEKGKIEEHGSHKELMAANKKYAKLFRLQAEAYK